MDRIARWKATDRRDLFVETASRRGLAPAIIEKDFWVCWILRRLFALPEIGDHLIFKGGTSLSKVFKLIERFSEDIDLTVRRDSLGFGGENEPERGASNKEKDRRVGALRSACHTFVREVLLPQLRKTIGDVVGGPGETAGTWSLEPGGTEDVLQFRYPAAPFDAPGGGYVSRSVKLEFGASSDPEPIGEYDITPYAAEEFPDLFQESPTSRAIVLEAERTFWEKATLLHAEYHRPKGSTTPARHSRHYYDLSRLAGSPKGERAVAMPDLLERVAIHKSVYFKSGWARYDLARPGGLHLVPPAERLRDLSNDYRAMQEMFFDPESAPSFDEVLERLRTLEERINQTGDRDAAHGA